jgi:hypothetical protein
VLALYTDSAEPAVLGVTYPHVPDSLYGMKAILHGKISKSIVVI